MGGGDYYRIVVRKENCDMKQVKYFVAVFMASVLFVPFVYADTDPAKYAKVEEYRPSDSVKTAPVPTIVGSQEAKVTVTYTGSIELKVQETGERGYEAAWFGFKVTKPTGIQADKAKIRRAKVGTDSLGVEGEYRVFQWNDAKDDGQDEYVSVYVSVTKEELEAAATSGESIVKTWEFSWDDNEDDYEQVLEVIIDPKEITLKPKDSEEPVFTPETYEELYDEAHPQVPVTPEEPEETNPNTGDINVILLGGLMLLSGFGLGYVVKRRYN